MANRPRRTNGLTRPFSKSQIAAWIAFILSVVEFVLFISPILPFVASIPVTLFFMLSAGTVLYFGVQAQIIDPVDVHLYNHLKEEGEINNHQNNNSSSNGDLEQQQQQQQQRQTKKSSVSYGTRINKLLNEPPPQESMKQCWICDTQVAEHSMHCKFCNKCVYHFDHHCMWLNTCVGTANYWQFYKTMVSLFAMEFIHFTIHVVLLIDSWVGGPTKERTGDWMNANQRGVVHGVMLFFIVFDAISMIMLGQLIWFHLGLQKNNLSTYEYIVQDHKKKREIAKREGDMERQRVLQIDKAEREGRNWAAFRLQCGGFCRGALNCPACDPLVMPPPPNPQRDGFATALGPSQVNNNNHNMQSGDVCYLSDKEKYQNEMNNETGNTASDETGQLQQNEDPLQIPQVDTSDDFPNDEIDYIGTPLAPRAAGATDKHQYPGVGDDVEQRTNQQEVRVEDF